jgi:ABC-type multidrug transport system ATPase subunit
LAEDARFTLSGQRFVNGLPVAGDSMLPAAFVEQDTAFFPYMTVRETLQFRVELGLGSQLSTAGRDQMVNDLLSQLGLLSCADTIVGNQKVRGISGGERKRLSIAVEMISSPSVLFLDEPTSGLDSTAATSLVETLRELADQGGKTIVTVIHQPSQHVFGMFDDLLLVSEGRLMYYGERAKVRGYMEQHGCKSIAEMGTAEHILDCISRTPLLGESDYDASDRLDHLADLALRQPFAMSEPENDFGSGLPRRFRSLPRRGPKAGIITQFKLLFQRSMRGIVRGKSVLLIKLVQQVVIGLIYGGIYSITLEQSSIQDRFGLLSLIAIGTANMAVATTSRAFPKEKSIVKKEISSNMYRTIPYFVGKAISEIPLSALLSSIFGTIVYRLTGLSNVGNKFQRFLGILTMHTITAESAGLAIGAFSATEEIAVIMFPAVMVLSKWTVEQSHSAMQF